MPRYFLHHVLSGDRVEDDEGYVVADCRAAEWEAILNIRSIVGASLSAGGTIPDGHVEIVDDTGEIVSIIQHDKALRPSRPIASGPRAAMFS